MTDKGTLRLGPLCLPSPSVMGILNVTPDSFSDGGRYLDAGEALRRAQQIAEAGAAIIDVGGESTRPGSEGVGTQEEIDRVVPVIEAIHGALDLPISIDTSKPDVMRAAVAAGAAMINDVFALRRDDALQVAAGLGVPVCLMHMQGEPRSMQDDPHYEDVVAEVAEFLETRIDACVAAGIDEDRIVVDPGFGFGKSVAHNLVLLRELAELVGLGYPVMAGLSRKSTLGAVTGRPAGERMPASIAAALMAVQRGARIVRVHDVAATRDALAVLAAVDGEQ